MLTRRLIDAWRHERVRAASGEIDVAEDTLREIIAGTGLNHLDGFVRDSLVDALNDAMRLLPPAQRRVVEAQVFAVICRKDDQGRIVEALLLQGFNHAPDLEIQL